MEVNDDRGNRFSSFVSTSIETPKDAKEQSSTGVRLTSARQKTPPKFFFTRVVRYAFLVVFLLGLALFLLEARAPQNSLAGTRVQPDACKGWEYSTGAKIISLGDHAEYKNFLNNNSAQYRYRPSRDGAFGSETSQAAIECGGFFLPDIRSGQAVTAATAILSFAGTADPQNSGVVVVESSYDEGQNWQAVDSFFLQGTTDNATNSGYRSYPIAGVTAATLPRLRFRLRYVNPEAYYDTTLFLDGLALDVQFAAKPAAPKQDFFHVFSPPEQPVIIIDQKTLDTVEFLSPDGMPLNLPFAKEVVGGKTRITIQQGATITPGTYIIRAKSKKFFRTVVEEHSFSFGVLNLNTPKSAYETGDLIPFAIGVLDYAGRTVCNASLALTVTKPNGAVILFRTDNGSIAGSAECGPESLTNQPDYSAQLLADQPGTYTTYLEVQTNQGPQTATNTFTVGEKPAMIIERLAPTRINPRASYVTRLHVTPVDDYKGHVLESMPVGFSVSDAQPKAVTSSSNDRLLISWEVDWKANQTYELAYTFHAPEVSPELFLLGPLQIGEFVEPRTWSMSSDELIHQDKAGVAFEVLPVTDEDFVPDRNALVEATKKVFTAGENAQIKAYKRGYRLPDGIVPEGLDPKKVIVEHVDVRDPEGTADHLLHVSEEFTKEGKDLEILHLVPQEGFKPGVYTITTVYFDGEKKVTQTDSFAWGVLAMNMPKSVYRPDEEVVFHMGTVDAGGRTICTATMELTVSPPEGAPIHLSTGDQTIQYSKECGPITVTNSPDYSATYTVGTAGDYTLTLTGTINDVPYTIHDTLFVRETIPFDITRIAPTRVWPGADYDLSLTVVPKEDYHGDVVEYVPTTYGVVNIDQGGVAEPVDENTQRIRWQVDWQAGTTNVLAYTLDPENISPALFLLGPATIGDFAEYRQWQIASDATCTSPTGVGLLWTTAAWTGCTGGGYPGQNGTGDLVVIQNGVTMTMNVTPANSIGGLSLTGGAAATTLTFGAFTLTNTGTTSINAPTASVTNSIAVATGTYNTGSVTITAGTSTQISQLTVTTGTITVTGNITSGGTASASRFVSTGASTLNIRGNFTPGAMTGTNNGLINFNGTSVTQTVGAFTLYYDVRVGGLSNIALTGGTTTITHNLTVNSGCTYRMGNAANTVTGTTDVTGTIDTITGATGTRLFTGAITVNAGGRFDLSGQNPPVTFGANLTNNSSNQFKAGSGTTTFNANLSFLGSGSGGFLFNQNPVTIVAGRTLTNGSSVGTVTFTALTISSSLGGNGMTLNDNSITTVTNALIFSANGGLGADEKITLGSSTGSETFTVGSLVMNGSTNTGRSIVTCATNNTGTFTVTGTAAITGSTTAIGKSSLTMGTCTLSVGATTLTGAANATGVAEITSSTGVLTFTNGLTFAGGANIANAKLTTTGAATINFAGTISGAGTLTEATGTLNKFTGASTAVNTAYTTWKNWEVVSGTTTLGGAQTITGLQIDTGATLAGATFLLTDACTATGVDGFRIDGTLSGTGGVALNTAGCVIDAQGAGAKLVSNTGTFTISATMSVASTANISIGAAGGTNPLAVTSGTTTNNGTVSILNSGVGSGLTGAGGWVQANGSTLNTAGDTTTAVSIATFSASTNANTVNYNGAAQTVKDPTAPGTVHAYYHLVLGGSGAKAMTGVTTTQNFTMTGSATTSGNVVTTINGNVDLSGTSMMTTGAALTITGTLTVQTGAILRMGNFALTASSTSSISGTLDTSGGPTSTRTFSGNVTVNSGGTWDLTGQNPPTSFGGDITANTGVVTFNNGSGGATWTASKQLAGTANMIFGGTNTINAGFTLTNNNTGIVTFATINGGDSSSSLATGVSSYTKVTATPMLTGTIVPSTSANTFDYNYSSPSVKVPTTNPYYNLSLSGGGITILPALTSINGTLALSGSGSVATGSTLTVALDVTVATGTTFNVNHNLTISGGDFTNAGTGVIGNTSGTPTVTISGIAGSLGGVSGSTTFYNLTLSDSITFGSNFTVRNNLTLPSSVVANSKTVTMTGTAGSLIGSGATLYDLTIDPTTAGTMTLQDGVAVSHTLTVAAGDTAHFFDANAYFDLQNSTSTSLVLDGTVDGNGTLYYYSSTAFPTSGIISSLVYLYPLSNDMSIPGRTFGGDLWIEADNTTPHTITFGSAGGQTITIGGYLKLGALSTANLTIDAATYDPAVTVGTDLDFIGSASGTEIINAGAGAWTISRNVDFRDGQFNIETGNTVTLNGSSKQTITSNAQPLYNLTLTNTSGSFTGCGSPMTTPGIDFADALTVNNNYVITAQGVKVEYNAGSTYTFQNINWNGAATDGIVFRSSAASAWNLDINGTQTDVSYVSVAYSNATLTAGGVVASNGTNTDCNNNTNWIFIVTGISITGTAFTDDTEGTPLGSVSVCVAVNATQNPANCNTTNGSGVFTITSVGATIGGEQLTLFIDGGTTFGNTVTKGDGADILAGDSLRIYQNHVIVRYETGASFAIVDMDAYDNDQNATDMLFDAEDAATDTLTVEGGSELFVPTGFTFAPGGNLWNGVNGISGLDIRGTFTASAGADYRLSGNFANAGTYTTSTETVTMIGTSNTIDGGGVTLYNLTIDPSSTGTITLQTSDLSVSSLFTVAAGDTLAISSGRTLTLTGSSGTTLSLNGTINGAGRLVYSSIEAFPTGGTISSILRMDCSGRTGMALSDRAGTDYGGDVEIYNNNGTFTSVSFDIGTATGQTINFGGSLSIITDGTQGIGTGATNSSAINIAGNLGFTGLSGVGQLSTGSGTWTVSGNIDLTNGIFSATSGNTIVMDGTSKTLTSDSETLQNFAVGGGSIANVGAMDVNGTFDVTSGAFTAATEVNMNVAGNFTLALGTTFTGPTGAGILILDGDLTLTDSTAVKQNLGNVQIGTSPDTTNLASDTTYKSLTVTTADFFYTNGYDIDVNGNLTISGTFDATDDVEADETTINCAGNFTINSTATFVQNQSTLIMDATSLTKTLITDGSFSLYNLTLSDGGGSLTVEVQDALDVDNNLTITGGTLDAVFGEGNWINVGGNWDNDDTFNARANTVIFDAPSGTKTIDADGTGADSFYTMLFNDGGGSATYQLSTVMDVDNNLTITGGNFDANSNTLTIGGNWDNDDTFTSGTQTTTFDAPSGTKTIDADGTGAEAFSNVIFNDGGGGTTWQLTTLLDVNADLIITGGTLDFNGSNTLFVGGNFTNKDTIVQSTGTLQMDNASGTKTIDTSEALSSAASDFNNIIFNDGGGAATYKTAYPLDLDNNLTITGGTLDTTGPTTWYLTNDTYNGAYNVDWDLYNMRMKYTDPAGSADNTTVCSDGGGGQTGYCTFQPGIENTTWTGSAPSTIEKTGWMLNGGVPVNGSIASGTWTLNATIHYTAGTCSYGTRRLNARLWKANADLSSASVIAAWAGNATINAGVNDYSVSFTGVPAQTLVDQVLYVEAQVRLGTPGCGGSTPSTFVFRVNEGGTKQKLTTPAFTPQINFGGSWVNNDTFTHGSGTVVVDGSTQQTLSGAMTGSSAFNNLTITNNSGSDPETSPSVVFLDGATAAATFTAVTENTKLRFAAGATYTFQNIVFNGQAVGTRVFLRSSMTGTQWNLNVAGTLAVSNTNVRDSNACGQAPDINATDGTDFDATNNTCWSINTITFSLSDTTIGFGSLSVGAATWATGDLNGSASDTTAHTMSIATNARSGYAITYIGANLMSFSGQTIDSATIANDEDGIPGTEQFAIGFSTNGNATIAAGYDHNATPAARDWEFTPNAMTTVVSEAGPTATETISAFYLGNISGLTESGVYSTNVTFIATSTF